MELVKQETTQLKLENLEFRESLNNKFRHCKKDEDEKIQPSVDDELPAAISALDGPTSDAMVARIAQLQSNILELETENASWRTKLDENVEVKESLETKVRTLQEQVDALQTAWSLLGDSPASRCTGSGTDSERAFLTALMRVHHPIVQRPLDLQPVKKLASLAPDAVDDLVSRFVNASTSSKDRQNILFFRAPGRIVWCNEPHSNGYLYGPMHQLIVSEHGLRWNTDSRPLQALYNQERELLVLEFQSQHDLAKNTLHLEGKVPDSCYNQAMAFVSRLWSSPFMKAEVLGMQCVGFNNGLYNSLRAKAETWNWKVPTLIKEPGDDRPWKRQRMW